MTHVTNNLLGCVRPAFPTVKLFFTATGMSTDAYDWHSVNGQIHMRMGEPQFGLTQSLVKILMDRTHSSRSRELALYIVGR